MIRCSYILIISSITCLSEFFFCLLCIFFPYNMRPVLFVLLYIIYNRSKCFFFFFEILRIIIIYCSFRLSIICKSELTNSNKKIYIVTCFENSPMNNIFSMIGFNLCFFKNPHENSVVFINDKTFQTFIIILLFLIWPFHIIIVII